MDECWQSKTGIISDIRENTRVFSSSVQRGKCKCVDRGGAGAGGEATLAVQGLPAGAERVPAEATQASQVALHSHVTSHHLDVKTEREDGDEPRWERRAKDKKTAGGDCWKEASSFRSNGRFNRLSLSLSLWKTVQAFVYCLNIQLSN